MKRFALRILNGAYGFVVGTALFAAAAVSAYSIWDNAQVYKSVEDVQNQVRQYKPIDKAESGPTFDELRQMNQDVIAWITVDGTNVDYPVLQADNNLTYMNKDFNGDFSLGGSIFMDFRNKPDFSENYSLIYGHNMEKHLMFGDLALFKDKKFFAENKDATLMIPGESRKLKVASILQISAGTDEIFNPSRWEESLKGFGKFLSDNSIWYHSDIIKRLINKPENFQVVALATCSDGNTNDRTILILVYETDHGSDTPPVEPSKPPTDEPSTPPADEPTPGGKSGGDNIKKDTPDSSDQGSDNSRDSGSISGTGPKPTGDTQNPTLWIIVIAGVIVAIVIVEILSRKKRD